MKTPTAEMLAIAKEMFANGEQVRTIAKRTGMTRYQVEGLFFPERNRRRRARAADYRSQRWTPDQKRDRVNAMRFFVPESVLAERDRIYAEPHPNLGDPPFSRSALAKKLARGEAIP